MDTKDSKAFFDAADLSAVQGESISQIEDHAMKAAAQFFGAELLPVLGIKGEILHVAPTEQIYLELKGFYEDFNYRMTDGTWRHFEFESDAVTEDDLRRFRAYEAVCSYHYKVEVITSVVCSSSVRQLRSELRNGINTYRIQIIRLKDRDAGKVIGEKKLRKEQEALSRQDLVELLLTPLMDGSMTQSERIRESLIMIQGERDKLGKEDLLRMESMMYAFAMKFLTRSEMTEIKEVLTMTELGQLLAEWAIEKGLKQGLEQGIQQGLEQGIQQGVEQGLEKGLEQGLEQGLERVNRLNICLVRENRQDDIIRASTDRQYQQKLFEEFGL